MSLDTSPVPELSAQQRRCNLLLMLYAPLEAVQLENANQLNGVDLPTTQKDIAQLSEEVQRLHRLSIYVSDTLHCQLGGSLLDKRICLINGLRRAIRSSPEFIHQYFAPLLEQTLSQKSDVDYLHYQQQFPRLIARLSQLLNREFSARDEQFLQLYFQLCLWQNIVPTELAFTDVQRQWLHDKPEYAAATLIYDKLQTLCEASIAECERDFFALLLTLIKNHSYDSSGSVEDLKLMRQVEELVANFQDVSGMTFSSYEGLISQLFAHLGPAIERCRFDITVDSQLQDEVNRMYPRLMRTTHDALQGFKTAYSINFSSEEVGLVAVIFGAWLMQGNALQEKQILLLTHSNPDLEQAVEQQIREATLMPLNIKYQTLDEFHQQGAPSGVSMIVTPYATQTIDADPLIIYTQLPLTKEERKRIRSLLEAQ
ncbi:stationary phase inducible protein CsiE [Rouxiella silvae]|uniref:Stationary phase inducible protein CsiE n=1 Tax=Rouxiella silvae TaxID=1646373 RepID=A0ABX3U4Z7_9GAMM|nr:stationary phase inducible protein CsiE [Rouxiella silvae]KQN44208.1 stationary phase inducible protein CsiE [Serratia sp. Leaf50]ORJ22574.1 stationary phase inducible protein CsiE [Rouxiella silvae]